MTEKIKNEIKIKARQITDDLISFMQKLDTVTNKENKELKIDAKYYQNRITALEKQLNKKIYDELGLTKNSAVSEQIVQTTHHWLSACEKISALEQEKCELLEIIRKYYKYNPSCGYSYEDIDNEAKQFLENKEIKHYGK